MMSHIFTFIQVGIGEAASQLLDDVDGLQVSGALQPHDGVNSQLGEVIFVVSQQFGGQRCPGDVQQVLLETSRVVAMEM